MGGYWSKRPVPAHRLVGEDVRWPRRLVVRPYSVGASSGVAGIDRMSYYVNKDAYRGAVRAETAALHQPSQTNGAAR